MQVNMYGAAIAARKRSAEQTAQQGDQGDADKGNTTASQPFSKQRIGVTNPNQFLDSLLPYMERQEMISKSKQNGKVYYDLIH